MCEPSGVATSGDATEMEPLLPLAVETWRESMADSDEADVWTDALCSDDSCPRRTAAVQPGPNLTASRTCRMASDMGPVLDTAAATAGDVRAACNAGCVPERRAASCSWIEASSASDCSTSPSSWSAGLPPLIVVPWALCTTGDATACAAIAEQGAYAASTMARASQNHTRDRTLVPPGRMNSFVPLQACCGWYSGQNPTRRGLASDKMRWRRGEHKLFSVAEFYFFRPFPHTTLAASSRNSSPPSAGFPGFLDAKHV